VVHAVCLRVDQQEAQRAEVGAQVGGVKAVKYVASARDRRPAVEANDGPG
jgi:hypothetical protein